MPFAKDEDHLLTMHRQIALALHQVVELLDSGNADIVVILVQLALRSGGYGRHRSYGAAISVDISAWSGNPDLCSAPRRILCRRPAARFAAAQPAAADLQDLACVLPA